MYIFVKTTSVARITNRTCLYIQFGEILQGIPKLNRPMGLQPSSHTPKLNQIEAGQSQLKNQNPVSGLICNHRASGQASLPSTGVPLKGGETLNTNFAKDYFLST